MQANTFQNIAPGQSIAPSAPAAEAENAFDETLDKIRKGRFKSISSTEMNALSDEFAVRVLYGGLTRNGKIERMQIMADDIFDAVYQSEPERLTKPEQDAAKKRIGEQLDDEDYQATKRFSIYRLYKEKYGEMPTRHIRIERPINDKSPGLMPPDKADTFFVEILPNNERGRYEELFDATADEQVIERLRQLAESDKQDLNPRSVEILQHDAEVIMNVDAAFVRPDKARDIASNDTPATAAPATDTGDKASDKEADKTDSGSVSPLDAPEKRAAHKKEYLAAYAEDPNAMAYRQKVASLNPA